MATSSKHHKKRIESYKASWAHLCQSAEGKALWEAVACTDRSPLRVSFWDCVTPALHPCIPLPASRNFSSSGGLLSQGSHALEMVMASFPLLSRKACFHINFLWGNGGLPVAVLHIHATFLLSTRHCPAAHHTAHLVTLPKPPLWGGPRLQTYLFLLPCPLKLPLLRVLLTTLCPRGVWDLMTCLLLSQNTSLP